MIIPETLNEFYNHMLLAIEAEDQEYAHRALQWIAFSVRPISLEELSEAIVVQPESNPYLNNEDRFMDPQDVLNILPSGFITTEEVLVTQNDLWEEIYPITAWGDVFQISEHETKIMVHFAHFSVQEYLMSNRLGTSPSPVAYYHFEEPFAQNMIPGTCMAYLLFAGNQNPPVTERVHSDFPCSTTQPIAGSCTCKSLKSWGQRMIRYG